MDRRIFGRIGVATLLTLAGSARAHAAGDQRQHRIVLQVSTNDPALMNLALGNIENIAAHYEGTGERVSIDLTAFGPGYVMMRADTSPVKSRIKEISQRYPFVRFSACQNSRRAMAKSEGKDIPEVAEAIDVPAGVVHIAELQEQGWSYLRP
jgi:intracellular sulfur oxidation DsrE/DsrF family protein